MSKPETISELLAEAQIRLKRIPQPGQSVKTICPKCDGGRTREQSLSLTIDADGAGATWQCHRGHCGHTGGQRLSAGSYAPRRAMSYQEPPPYEPEPSDKPDALYEFFDLRGISADTVDHFGLYMAERSFRVDGEWRKHPSIAFPYLLDGHVVNRKYRALADKGLMAQEREPQPTLWNIDAVVSDDVLIWVEGEPDVMACHEAGIRQVVTLKDGAPDKLRNEDDPARDSDKRFAALSTHAEKLAGIKKIVLAGDDDEPGRILREELARRLGRHRCFTVQWPTGCKDAGDVLRQHGPSAVVGCLEAARPWPIEGVQQVSGADLRAHISAPPPPVMTTGAESTDRILSLPGEGRIIVVTGFPNSGKSSWTRFTMVNSMAKHSRRWLVFSPEMQPLMEFAAQCAQVLMGKPARAVKSRPNLEPMDDRDLQAAGDWLQDRMSFLATDSEDKPPTIEWILEKARDCVLRMGVTDLLIDPWNEIEQPEGEQETRFIGRALQRLRAFGLRHGCNVWIVAHPAKPTRNREGLLPSMPGPYDIAGSAHWANKADVGITIHRPEKTTELHLWKARFGRWGQKGTSAALRYDVETCRYIAA